MLKNSWILQKSHFLIKNNFYLTNIFMYKVSLLLWKNANLYTISLFEKYFLEYWIKNIYLNLINYLEVYKIITVQGILIVIVVFCL